MSRNLPARPNLEYLKKEAKDLLDALRRADSSAQLADAQFALAREYGFDSWPKLKAHVESIAPAPNPLAGGWIANVAKSKRHPANPFRTARIHFAVTGNRIDIVDEFVDEAGKPVRGRHRVDVDGVERDSGNGDAVSASWSGNGFVAMVKKDGQIVGRATYDVSDDGCTLTIGSHDGESLIVLDRQQND